MAVPSEDIGVRGERAQGPFQDLDCAGADLDAGGGAGSVDFLTCAVEEVWKVVVEATERVAQLGVGLRWSAEPRRRDLILGDLGREFTIVAVRLVNEDVAGEQRGDAGRAATAELQVAGVGGRGRPCRYRPSFTAGTWLGQTRVLRLLAPTATYGVLGKPSGCPGCTDEVAEQRLAGRVGAQRASAGERGSSVRAEQAVAPAGKRAVGGGELGEAGGSGRAAIR